MSLQSLRLRRQLWQRLLAEATIARDQFQGDIDTAKAEIGRIEAEIEKEKGHE